MTGRTIEDVVAERAGGWLALPGVTGVYRGETPDGGPCVVVMLRAPAEEMRGLLPAAAEGYPVILEEAADLRPMRGRQGPV